LVLVIVDLIVKKRDLVYSWGMPIIGFPISGFLIVVGWIISNTASLDIFLISMLFLISGIAGFIASVLMLNDVKKGIISPMFV